MGLRTRVRLPSAPLDNIGRSRRRTKKNKLMTLSLVRSFFDAIIYLIFFVQILRMTARKMTEKLYDYDAYMISFDAKVLECVKTENCYRVCLDKTAFFPEEGGQTSDIGSLENAAVTHVEIKNDDIFHYASSPLEVGAIVHGEIDWNHRYRNMQMHSAEHIFSGLVYRAFGFCNVGFHLSDNSATMDYDGKISLDDIKQLENIANEAIVSGKVITALYPSKEELSAIDYRSKKELSGAVRIVTVEGIDVCACCAPHVANTSEIGIFKVISVENYKGGVRIHYLAGKRALEDYDARIDCLNEVSKLLSAKSGDEILKLQKVLNDYNGLKLEYNNLKTEFFDYIIRNNKSDKEYGFFCCDGRDSSYMKFIMESLRRVYSGTCFVFAKISDNEYRYLIESDTEDLSVLSLNLRERYGAKGGGRKNSIQGTVCSNDCVERLKGFGTI